VINNWVNTPGQLSWRSGCYCGLPVESPGDPPSDLRQFAEGYFGLQNHGDTDVVEYGPVIVRDLSGTDGAFAITGDGSHVVQFRSIDEAGNVEPIQSVKFTIGSHPALETRRARAENSGGCTVGPVAGADKAVTCSYVAGGNGSYQALTTSVWSITVRHRVGRQTISTLVAVHASAPSLPVSGTFKAAKGDVVVVRLGPDLNTPRDSNVPANGAIGTVIAADA
jgi:hypothetical protein